jgi:GTPase SAR1 family protein
MLAKACGWCCFGCCGGGNGKSNRIGGLDRKIFLLMLGLDNAGKTCVAKALVGDTAGLEAVAPTIGFSKVETKYKGFQVVIYDLGGNKGFRSIWEKYYHEVS